MLTTFGYLRSFFGRQDDDVANDAAQPDPETVNSAPAPDALGYVSGDVGYQRLNGLFPLGGATPGWVYRQPPGVGDAPQHVWAHRLLAPISHLGPGDSPATYLRMYVPPVVAQFAMRWQGMGVDGGNMLMTGLYAPSPSEPMANDIFAGQ